jgi:hypothetical protein
MAALRHRTNLPAAVLKDGEPGSDNASRLVPKGVVELKVGNCVLGYFSKPKKRRKPNLAALQGRQAITLFADRFSDHGIVPDLREARRFSTVIADLLPPDTARDWIARHCDELPENERDAILAGAMDRPRVWSIDDLGNFLRVSQEERDRLKLTNIGVAGMSKTQRQRLRRERHRVRVRAQRAMGGKDKQPSQEAAAPWAAAGISRRTWFRRKKDAIGTADGTEDVRSNYNISAAHKISATGSANSATKATRLSIEQAKPWEAEGVSRRTWFRRRQAAKADSSGTPRPIKQKATATRKAKAKTPPASASIIDRNAARAVAARVAAITNHLEATARPLRALVRATSSFPLSRWRPCYVSHS